MMFMHFLECYSSKMYLYIWNYIDTDVTLQEAFNFSFSRQAEPALETRIVNCFRALRWKIVYQCKAARMYQTYWNIFMLMNVHATYMYTIPWKSRDLQRTSLWKSVERGSKKYVYSSTSMMYFLSPYGQKGTLLYNILVREKSWEIVSFRE